MAVTTVNQSLLDSLSPNISTVKDARGDVKIFLVYKGDTIQFPVNPAEITFKTPNSNQTIPIISLGEVNILKDPKLQSIYFKSFFPVAAEQNHPYVLTGNAEANFYTALIKQVLGKQNKTKFLTPEQYVAIINEIRAAKEPIRFFILGLPGGVNNLFSIEKFDYSFEDGDYDISYEIELKLYKLYSLKECKLNPDGSITVDDNKGLRYDDSDQLLAPYSKCPVNVDGRIYKDPALQFATRYLKNKMGAYVGLVDFDENGAIHLRDKDGGWLGWCTGTAVSKFTGML